MSALLVRGSTIRRVDPDALRAAATRCFEGALRTAGATPGRFDLAVDEGCPAHPLVPGATLPSIWTRSGTVPKTLHLHAGAFEAVAEAERVVEREVEDAMGELGAGAAFEGGGELFEAHAHFRSGEPLPALWYRAGTPLAPFVWRVDLDLFVELRLAPSAWTALRGARVELTLLGDTLPVEIPADADASEVLTLEGAGLAEENPDPDTPDEVGDLHLLPLVF